MLLEEEDRPVVPGVTVRAASLDSLVEFLISCFLPVGGLKDESNNFPHVMFIMHQWFVSSESLAGFLIKRFSEAESSLHCHPSCPHTFQRVTDCAVYQYRAQICQAFRYWMRMFPIHFDLNATLASIIKDFQKRLHDHENKGVADLLDLSKLPSYDWARNMSVRNVPTKRTRKISLVFDHLEPAELVDHITFLEHKAMRRITFEEFKRYAECGTLQSSSKLERSIAFFNGLSQWIQFMVLSRSLPQQRADVIRKIVDVAENLRIQKNFNSLMSVVGGLSHSCLARLSKTNELVPQETKKKLEDLSELLSSTSNFSNYRKALSESKGFKIPILGVHMKDLIILHVALPDTVEDGLINFRKIAQLSLIFQELWELQNSIPSVMVNSDLINTLKLSLESPYSEDELYELSLVREPRISLSQQSSPSKMTVFSEWVAGLGEPPDEETLDKYLMSIIDVVYKNYDTDKDEYLCQDEFDMVLCNFPTIPSFMDLDCDHDGLISKADMKEYFLKHDLKPLRTGFQHEFNETTYFKPTFCGHCAGLLWGLIKQGYKCKDCGINAHKHCKELVVLECRRTLYSTPRSNTFAPPEGTKGKSRMQRAWKRQLKASQSDAETTIGATRRSSIDRDFCNCDNGFINTRPMNDIEISQEKETFPRPKPFLTKAATAPSSPCFCQHNVKMTLPTVSKLEAKISSIQCQSLEKHSCSKSSLGT